jgi:hypothetical protein
MSEGAMQEYFLITIVLSVILLALWRWDEYARREERHRRHLENSRRQGRATAP